MSRCLREVPCTRMADQSTEQLHELPLMKLGSLVSSLPFVLSNAFKAEPARADTAKVEVDAAPAKIRNSTAAHISNLLPIVRQGELDEVLSAGDLIAHWEPRKWKRIKTLAPAAGDAGVVELMSSQDMGQQVAVKRLPRELLMSNPQEFEKQYPDAIEHPWRDIAMVKHLNSLDFPYVCQFLGVFIGQDQVYVMTSFANQGDLFSWWQKDKSSAGVAREAVMRPILSQMFEGICSLHNRGIAHGDLSLENVLLHDTGGNGLQVKIIDFGMASLSRRANRQVRGKRSYQAPEMHGSSEYDLFLADNFAAGVITYCMAVHYYPWEHTKPGKDANFEFARKRGLEIFLQRTIMPGSMRSVAEIFSHSFVELLCGLLAFAPERRYSLGEVCLEEDVFPTGNHQSSFLLDVDAASDVSTADSLDSNCRDPHKLWFDVGCNVDDDKAQSSPSRMSVWQCKWLSEESICQARY